MTAQTLSAVRPLVARVTPIAGETLMSLLVRACEANAFERPSQLLVEAGFTGDPRFVPFTGAGVAPSLARLLGVAEAEVSRRMHAPVAGEIEPTLVGWWGTALERRFLEARSRRVAPQALRTSTHHRAAWTVRALSFCPKTFQKLISSCPSCSGPLGWWKTCGGDRCEHCKARLAEAPSDSVPEELHAPLRQVTDLISPEEKRRRAAVEQLPVTFRSWNAGELFSAAVEFGAACEHPAANRRSPEAKALARGQLGEGSPKVLASGWRVLAGWPASLDELVARVAHEIVAHGGSQSLALRDVGLLGRHLDQRLPKTRFRRLVREHLGEATLKARAPIKFRLGIEDLREEREVLTITEAAKATGISREVLLRLCPDGEGFAGGRRGQGGALRFHADRLGRASRAFDDALLPASAAAALGVPEYCLLSFAKRRLITLVDDPDILRMKRTPFAVSQISIDRLAERFAHAKDDPSALGERLDLSLAHRFAPAVWAGVFVGLLRGRSGFSHLEEAREGHGLSRRIYADQELIEACAAEVNRPRLPRGMTVTAQTAALLLGVSLPPLLSLIDEEWLKAERGEGAWRVPLVTLAAFDRAYVLAPELAHRTHGYSRLTAIFSAPPEPAFQTRCIRGWERQKGERWHGLVED